jgi:DNA-binding response OmpR family regulator
MRVLIVDDEADFRTSIIEILQLNGCQAFGVGSLSDYFALSATDLFDLAVIDWRLKDGDGLNVLRHIREGRNVPVVLITGSAAFESPAAKWDLKPDLYIAKPFAVEPLLAFIKAMTVSHPDDV